MFLANHPESFCTSSCHQKLYVSWIPPPVIDSSVYKRYKAITTELSKVMEATAKQELENRLGSRHKCVPADSTAGVSLSGLTKSSHGRPGNQVTFGSHDDSAARQNLTMATEGSSTREGGTDAYESVQSIEVVELTSPNEEMELSSTFDRAVTAIPEEEFWGNIEPNLISAMVFHFRRDDDANRQDIVSMGEILNISTSYPSWTKLVEILKADDDFGLAFKEGRDFLMVNNQIRVGNERQFIACLQYLRNLKLLNSQVLVCSRGSTSLDLSMSTRVPN